jgi:hypothetical protein
MTRLAFRIFGLPSVLALAALAVATQSAGAEDNSRAKHVLLISVDGLHQTDLAWYKSKHPDSALARLVRDGVSFTNAKTPFPSDSFPGMVALVTGGNPKSTGVYYDDSFNHALLLPGTTKCAGAAPAVEVTYFEQLDKDPLSIDAGQGLAGLTDSILNMTSNPVDVIDPTQLPVDPATCKPVYPNQYLKVNTVFEVARAAGMRTAWSDKHPAYVILSGPSGKGVQDFFTPEINSNASVSGAVDWTKDNSLTQTYDGYKVQAVINEINGFDHSGKTYVGTPAIFGLNFQTVSTAQKLPGGGYHSDGVTPSAMLEGALDYIGNKLAAIEAAIERRGLEGSTTIILSAKHGQSPDLPSALTRIDDGKIIDALNAAWHAAGHANDLVAFAVNDDGWLMWTTDRSQEATDWAKKFLQNYSGTGNDIFGKPKAFTSAGLDPNKIYSGAAAAAFMGVPFGDPRVPDLIGVSQYGTVYTGGKGKIAEHGGNNPQDRDVPIVVSGGEVDGGRTVGSAVETTQIAPTILRLLGLDPHSLMSVQLEGTQALPIG